MKLKVGQIVYREVDNLPGKIEEIREDYQGTYYLVDFTMSPGFHSDNDYGIYRKWDLKETL